MKERLREILSTVGPGQEHNAMREYLQARILQTLQDAGAWTSLAFLGGTALRFLYATPRFSEDLDFTLEDRDADYDFPRLMDAVRATFAREGYAVEVGANMRTTVNKAFVRFPGLQYEMGLSPHGDQAFSVTVEVDTNPPEGAGVETSTVRRFVTLRLSHHDKPSLVAGKTAALLLRKWIKGRDVYDLVWYLSDPEWPEPNETLLANACIQAGRPELVSETAAWRTALVSRLSEAPWDHVRTDIDRFLERREESWMVERETVLSVLRQRGWM